jgi:hypothetical protein
MNDWLNWAIAIAAIVAAVAAAVSSIIYWKTFKSVNEQTAISRQQLDFTMREMRRPGLQS